MIEFNQLNSEQQNVILKNAMDWFKVHKEHIYKVIKPETPKIAPSGSDLYRPELWKDIHWKWFLDNSFLL